MTPGTTGLERKKAMAEYIDRQQIIGELNHIIETYMSDDTFQCFFAAAVVTDILSNVVMCQPSDDVAPVRHGRWVFEPDGGTRCSECNKRVRDVTGGLNAPVDLSELPYCPKCSAKMDGGGD